MYDVANAPRWRRAASSIPVLALAFAFALGGAAAAATPAGPGVQADAVIKRAVPPDHFPLRNTGRRPKLAGGQMYTIVSVGAPPSAYYGISTPVAFNDTGQIAGTADDMAKEGTPDCVLWTGSAFVDMSASMNDAECAPSGLSSAVSGVVHVVGFVSTPFTYPAVAFAGSMNMGMTPATAGGAMHMFTSNTSSWLFGVNSSGEGIGTAYYAPLTGFFYSYPPFVMPAGKASLEVAQPQCTTRGQRYCDDPYIADAFNCPFGGCSINDSGLILGYDQNAPTPSFLTYMHGKMNSAKDIPIMGLGPYSYAFLNNRGQIAYSSYTMGTPDVASYVYSMSTKKTMAIPTIPGNSCAYYYVISFSNAGQVLGETGNCSDPEDHTYFTWDPVNGTQNLLDEINFSGFVSISPLGVNDNGQILVQLGPTSGPPTWGTLNPPAMSAIRGQKSVRTPAHPHA
jgi:hypothetical protein